MISIEVSAMPKLYEVNTDNDVLCYIPSGKISDNGRQTTQFSQDGETCWFYSTKRLAKAMGFKFDDPKMSKRYELISTFRKTQSKLDTAILIAATILVENCPDDKIERLLTIHLLIQRGLLKAHQFNYRIAEHLTHNYISPEKYPLFRQLKSFKDDAQMIMAYIQRYKTYNPSPITSKDPKTIEAIVLWLKARNPYQSQLLECACDTADKLNSLGSTQFSKWSDNPRKLIQTTSTPLVSNLFSTERPSVIILGDGSEHTSNQAPQQALTVQEKQIKRASALLDFSEKINNETFAVFKMKATTFSTAMELMDQLKQNGPVIISGYYGSSYYASPPQVLKDKNGKVQLFGTRKLIGWSKGTAMTRDNFNAQIAHQIIVIGVKYNHENPLRSHILFIDPNDSSFPGEQRKAYLMSFERLLQNQVTRGSVTAHYSISDNTSQTSYDRDVKGQTSNLLKYGTFAAIAATAGYVAYSALKNPTMG